MDTLEAAVFEGGFGIGWHKDVARAYEKLNPELRVNLWGDPRVDEKLRPRILRHNPPDLANGKLPVWKLIVAGKLQPLDDALDSPAYGQPDKTWRQTLAKGVLSSLQYEGKTYGVPSNLGAWCCWYDRALFGQHGWQPPKTWSEFIQLCKDVKSAGIAPLAYQGKYATYGWLTLISLFQRIGTWDDYYAVQDLVPGSFTQPSFVEACRLMQEMAQLGFQSGAMAMTHTESQMEWVNGRAAMVYCGTWLENEMKKAVKPEFRMACFAVPAVETGKGDPKAISGGGGETFYAFHEAPMPIRGVDFLKFMLSLDNARTYVERLSTLSTVDKCWKGVKVSAPLQSVVDIVENGSQTFGDRLSDLYLSWVKTVRDDAVTDLVSGKCTPEDCAKRMEAGAEAVRRDPDIYKPPPMGAPKE